MIESTTADIKFASAIPVFSVRDTVATAEYYRDVLGFQIAGFWTGDTATADPSTAQPTFAIVRRGDVYVYLSLDTSAAARTSKDDRLDVYFNVTGVDALAAELRERGADILDGPTDRAYSQRELVVRDCNGYVLAFGEDTSRR